MTTSFITRDTFLQETKALWKQVRDAADATSDADAALQEQLYKVRGDTDSMLMNHTSRKEVQE